MGHEVLGLVVFYISASVMAAITKRSIYLIAQFWALGMIAVLAGCGGSVIYIQGPPGPQGPPGATGQDAVLSSGSVGLAVPGKSYTECHHDYAYLSNGWLMFRHQANGTTDQGAGQTGFNTWNVDISDFLLISEVGGVVYCTLHFNKASKNLTYTVNDNTDGLAGRSSTINL